MRNHYSAPDSVVTLSTQHKSLNLNFWRHVSVSALNGNWMRSRVVQKAFQTNLITTHSVFWITRSRHGFTNKQQRIWHRKYPAQVSASTLMLVPSVHPRKISLDPMRMTIVSSSLSMDSMSIS